jgi:hypothetical protein
LTNKFSVETAIYRVSSTTIYRVSSTAIYRVFINGNLSRLYQRQFIASLSTAIYRVSPTAKMGLTDQYK